MRLPARKHRSSWAEDGVAVEGHEVERPVHGRAAEVRYVVRSPDGTPGTLVTSPRPYANRHERMRFRRLARRRAALDHPGAIPIRAVAEHSNHPVMITDPYPESTFGDVLEHEAPMTPERVVKMLAPVAEALDHAHAMGLIHRTLTADSLLLTGRDSLVLDVFGLVTPDDETTWGVIEAGDVRYRSPEQLRGKPVGPPGNVYSLTAILVHALTGEPPYSGDRTAVTYSHLVRQPPTVSERLPELGGKIDAVVQRGLAKDAFARYQSATELIGAAADALGVRRSRASGHHVPRPRLELVRDESQPPQAIPAARPGRRAVAVAVATAVLCGALAAAVLSPFESDGPAAAARPAGAAAWKQLARERVPLRERLAAARTPQSQALAASDLAALYDATARTGGSRALRAAARDAGGAYGRLAAAAGVNDDAGYADAARAIEQAETRLALAASRP